MSALAAPEAERTVVAAVLLANDDRCSAALYVAAATDYTDPCCGLVVACLRAIHERNADIDSAALRLELERRGKLAAVTPEWLIDVTDTLPNFALAVEAAERVKTLACARERRAEHTAIAALYDAGRIEEAEERAAALARLGASTVTRSRRMSIADAALGPFQRLMAAAETPPRVAADGRRRITTGMSVLDRVIRGLRSRSMLVFGMRPSVGKSTLMLQMARRQAQMGEVPGYISIEDDEDIAGERSLAGAAGVPLRWVGDGEGQRFTIEQWNALNFAMQLMQDAGGYVVVPHSPRADVICAEMRWLVREKGATCLYVDYLQKIRAKGRDMLERVSEAAAAIEEEAESLDVPLVTASQLSRPERGQEWVEPTLERLRYSGDIEGSADAVIMGWYDRAPSLDDELALIDPRAVNLRVAKLKWGPPGALLRLQRSDSGELHEIDDSYSEAAQ